MDPLQIFAGIMFASIIGIPFAIAHLKLMRLAIWPFGTDVGMARGTMTTVTTTHSYQNI
jgi:uncharacterized membrane protein YccF (DUF307 family)